MTRMTYRRRPGIPPEIEDKFRHTAEDVLVHMDYLAQNTELVSSLVLTSTMASQGRIQVDAGPNPGVHTKLKEGEVDGLLEWVADAQETLGLLWCIMRGYVCIRWDTDKKECTFQCTDLGLEFDKVREAFQQGKHIDLP